MSSTGEVENMAVEKVPEEAPVADKPMKEKKPKVAKEMKTKKTRKTVSHPPYFQMIEEALVALNEKRGSSPYAIGKFVEQKHKSVLPANFKKMLGLQLKNSAAKGKLIKVKASYKLSEPAKKAKKAEKSPEKKPEKKEAKRRSKRKYVALVAKPKQPKSIKAPAKKKANKASAKDL